MSRVAILIQQSQELGAQFQLEGGRVKVEGPSPLPSELMVQLRQHKREVASYLSSLAASWAEPVPAAQEAQSFTLNRLRRGNKWLQEQHRGWLADDPAAANDAEFSHALAGWLDLENILRSTGYQGCIHGPGAICPEDGPVVCDGCLGSSQRVVPETLAPNA